MKRVLLLSTTTGYQLRAFDSAAERLGIDLVFATDRCNQLEDPWRDRAIPVRFHQEWRSLDAIVTEAKRAPFDGVIAVGDRPALLAARVTERLNLPGNPPDAAAASGNKRETRARLAAARLPGPWFFTIGPARRCQGRNRAWAAPFPVRAEAAGAFRQPGRDSRGHA